MKHILLASLLLFSCGKPSDVNLTQDVQVQVVKCSAHSMPGSVRYEYTYSTTSCTTNCHSAQSLTDYCAYLRDDALNNYCAKAQRDTALAAAKCIKE